MKANGIYKAIIFVISVLVLLFILWYLCPYIFKKSTIEQKMKINLPEEMVAVDYVCVNRRVFAKLEGDVNSFNDLYAFFEEADSYEPRDTEGYYLNVILEKQLDYNKNYKYTNFDQSYFYSVSVSNMPIMSVVLVLEGNTCFLYMIEA